jgi:hypothetical protein
MTGSSLMQSFVSKSDKKKPIIGNIRYAEYFIRRDVNIVIVHSGFDIGA